MYDNENDKENINRNHHQGENDASAAHDEQMHSYSHENQTTSDSQIVNDQPSERQGIDQQTEQMHQESSSDNGEQGLNRPKHPNKQHPQRPKKRQWGSFWGGLAGGFVAAFLVVLLAVYNVIPGFSGDNGGEDHSSSASTNNNTQQAVTTMASDHADKADDLSGASKAVVGVLNLQQQNIWEQSQETASGSGIVYKKKGNKAYVVTNAHVVEGAEKVKVAFHSEDNTTDAKVLGTDKLSDLAILEIDGKKVDTVANLGDSAKEKVGNTVYAIGNPLGMNFSNSLTKGIISGLHRSVSVDTNGDNQPDWVTEVIQTDAAINPGNSGGALVNQNGKVIGINSMKIAQDKVEGIGFAIPMSTALPIMKQLESGGEVTRPFIGISTAPLNQVPQQYQERIQLPDKIKGGMVIANIEQGSPAAHAGLKQFDVITGIDGKDITSMLELRKTLYESSVGDTVKLDVYRNGKKQTVSLKLAKQDQKNM